MTFIIVSAAIVLFLVLVLGTNPITSLTGSVKSLMTWIASQTQASSGSGLNTINQNTTYTCQSTYSTTAATGANAANQGQSKVYSISASGTATIDLTAAFTNIVNNSAATWKRLKGIQIQLLSSAQDSANGTACTSITIMDNSSDDFISQSHSGWFASTTAPFDLANGQWMAWGTDNSAGVIQDATHKYILITNNDGANAAGVLVNFIGGDS
jgi:hypothetical protein